MSDIGIAQGVLGAAGDLFSGVAGFMGDQSAASAYKKAAKFATQNAATAERSGVIQEAQAARQIYQTVSGAQAAEASSGTGTGGSNQYLSRASLQQGGLQKAIIANNAQIQATGFKAEAAADTGQAQQAQAQGASSLFGGILGAVGSIIGI